MTLPLAVFLTALAAATGQQTGWSNPYLAPATEFEAKLQAARFGKPGADATLQQWLDDHHEVSSEERLRALHQLCLDYGFFTWYRLEAKACAQESALSKEMGRSPDGDDNQGMAAAFADSPSIRAIDSASVPLTWNSFGSNNAEVSANGFTSSWIVDTGAEITTITQSVATRMGVRPLATPIRVGTGTTLNVFGQVGVIDCLHIGEASVENVPVLILPDEQLKAGNLGQIDGILGLQVFIAFGRIAWTNNERTLALGEAAPKVGPGSRPIYWHDAGVGVPVATAVGVEGAQLDTGAASTAWSEPGTALFDPALVAKAKVSKAQIWSAGGAIEAKQKTLPTVAFRFGSVPVRLKDVAVDASRTNDAAVVGMDAVTQLGTLILDFDQMRMEGRLKSAAERKAAHRPALRKDAKLDDDTDPKATSSK